MTDLVAQWFSTAVGGLGWHPDVFWRASIREFFSAVEGHNRANRPGPDPLTMEELEELIEQYPDQ